MTIPINYKEASVLDAALAREAEQRELHKLATETLGQFADENQKLHADLAVLREELYQAKEARDYEMLNGIRLQQRLTVAEQRAVDLESALINVRETLGREYWDQYAGLDETRDILDTALKPATEPERPVIHNDPTPNYKLGPIIDAMRD